MKQLVEFLRSVTPADPWQLLYLIGTVFLFISPRLTWLIGSGVTFDFLVLGIIPVIIAGIFAYYGCFRPGKYPLRRVGLAVFLPAFLGSCLIISEFTFFNEGTRSIFAHQAGLNAFLHEWVVAFRVQPSGFLFAWIALAMLGIFAIRLQLGISSLPVRLGGYICFEDESVEPWNRMQLLIFVLVCPLFLLYRFSGMLFSIPSWSRTVGFSGVSLYIVLEKAITASLLVLVAILILGEFGRKNARSSLQLPKPRFALFGLMLPVLITFVISALQYGYDRAQWAAHDFGRRMPPLLASYFSLNDAWGMALVLDVFAAFAEEIVFRGMLLRPLLRRYGIHRGVFLTGLIWAASHFHGDMHQRYSIAQALQALTSRIVICSAMNYVLSWMTLRWNSVIPAAIAHTVSNVLIASQINGRIPHAHEMRTALWAVCALVLFQLWTPRELVDAESAMSAAIPPQPEASHDK
jgi:membrane protease YdiL (CAAX protease family)